MIGQLVKITTKEYKSSLTPNVQRAYELDGQIGTIVGYDDDGPDSLLTSYQVQFDDGEKAWFWRREFKVLNEHQLSLFSNGGNNA